MDRFETLEQYLRERCPELDLRREEPMERHTSFRVGGPVRLMALPRTAAEAELAAAAAREAGIVPFYMGNGSNLLAADAGAEEFVVKCFDGLDELRLLDETTIRAGSGVLLSRLANFALEQGLTGLEFAHGIPGSVGGAMAMNAGAYDGEMRQVAVATHYLDADGVRRTASGEEQGLGYRKSAFSGGDKLILGADFRLARGDQNAIKARMTELAGKRKEKQPLEYPSAGSTFKRPEGHFAAALIDGCGLKGYAVGGAQVSEKHAGFVVNKGGATCADILAVIGHVKETVLRETGVTLELEVKTLGL